MKLEELREYIRFTLLEFEKLEDNRYKSGYEDALKDIQKMIDNTSEEKKDERTVKSKIRV